MSTTELHFIFDAMPGPEGPRLIEVEDQNGHSIKAGEWRTRPDGLVELVIDLKHYRDGATYYDHED